MSDEPQPPAPVLSAVPDGDPDEFAGIEPPAPRRSPLVALVVIALGVVLGWHLRADLRYAFRPSAPLVLGEARSLAARGETLEDNTYVSLSGQPDRRNALFIEPRGEKSRQTFFRLNGSESRVFVRELDSSRRTGLQEKWEGRLRRFDTLPYAAPLRGYYADKVQAARYLSLDSVRAALKSGSTGALRDRTGAPVAVDAATPIHLDVAYSDDLVVNLWREKFPAEDDARHEVERLGLKVTGARKQEGPDYEIVIAAPAAERTAIIAKLDAHELTFAAHEESSTTRWSELKALPDGVKAVYLDAPIQIAGDAFVLTEGELPGSYWWAPVLLALLVGFMLFNVWYLVRPRLKK